MANEIFYKGFPTIFSKQLRSSAKSKEMVEMDSIKQELGGKFAHIFQNEISL